MTSAPRVLASLVSFVLLVAAVSCDGTNQPTTGALRLAVVTTGGDLDLNGYVATVDGAAPVPLPANGSAVVADLATGSHDVALTDVAANCTPSAQNPSSASVAGGDTTSVSFAMACVATGVRITTTTTGIDLDPDGYAVSVDGVLVAVVGVNGTVDITRLAVGSHTVTVTAVAANCPVAGGAVRSVSLVLGEVEAVAFDLTCTAVTGMIEVSAATSGLDLDADGYTVQVDAGSAQPLPINGTVRIPGLSGGDHTVTLASATGNCTSGGENPRTLPVTIGGTTRDTARTTFAVSCVAVTGVIEVTTATSGIDLDADGYTVQVDGGSAQPLPINGTVRFPGFSGGDHTVTLASAAGNCTSGGENPRTLPVTIGGTTRDTARTTFAVSCVAVTGVIEVTTVTSGVSLDANGYQVYRDGGQGQPVGVNAVLRLSGVDGGDHEVYLGDVAPNCPVTGQNPRTVSVAVGGATRDTARTTFTVVCEPATGTARIITVTTGADHDPDGYAIGVDCDDYYGCYYAYYTAQMSANDTVVVSGVPTGSHRFEVGQVAPNCTVSGDNPRYLHVTGGATTDIVFTVGCAAFGSIEVTTSTAGVDLDATGYRITADGPITDAASNAAVNQTLTLSGLLAGSYTVSLSGVSLNCELTNSNPVVVTVPSGGTATLSFAASCTAATLLAVAMSTVSGFEIHTVGSNQTTPAPLTNNTAYENAPDWSPDGSQIAFRSDRDGNAEIYRMQANGSGQTRLTTHAAGDYRPAWSPDGTKIAFVSNRDGNAEIYVMNADGTGVQRLTNHTATDDDPAWSPDGSKIAFTSDRGGSFGIHVMNSSDGLGVIQLTNDAAADSRVTWSPDGAKIAFARIASCEYYYCQRDLYVMNADGSGVALLTGGSDDHADPSWSPDGAWIAFNSAPCDYYYGCFGWTISAVRSSGADLRAITIAESFHPAWRP